MKPVHWDEYIEERPDVMLGKPVFKGTRLTVEHVLAALGNGTTESELLAGYSSLRPDHIRAAYQYAVALIRMEV